MQSIKLNKKVTIINGLAMLLNIDLTNNNGLVKVKLNNTQPLKEIVLANYIGYLDANNVWQFKINTKPGQDIWEAAKKEI